MNLIWGLVVLLIVLWVLGFAIHIGGGLIHLLLVIAAAEPAGAEKPLNAFETLTLAPIDRRLIDTRMLTAKERNWIDSYHARVQEVLSPLLDAATRAWLDAAARPLGSA